MRALIEEVRVEQVERALDLARGGGQRVLLVLVGGGSVDVDGLVSMMFPPVPFLRSVGYAGS